MVVKLTPRIFTLRRESEVGEENEPEDEIPKCPKRRAAGDENGGFNQIVLQQLREVNVQHKLEDK